MAKKKTRKQKSNKQTSTSEALAGPVSVSLAIATIGLVGAFGLVWWQAIEQPKQAAYELERERLLNQYTQLFNGRIAELRAQVGAMADSNTVSTAVVQATDAQRATLGAQIAEQHPSVLRVDIIPKGAAEVDLNAEVPVSFAALDLVRRAETKAFVGPEVSLNYRNLIYAAQPITGDGTVTGVVLVVFSSDFFLNPLSHFEARTGTLKIEQKFEGTPSTVVMQWGEAESSGATLSAQLFAPHWSLLFDWSDDALATIDSTSSLMVPFLVAWALLAGAIFLGMARFARQLRADADNLIEYLTRTMRKHPVRMARYNINIMRDVANAVAPFQTAAPTEAPAPAADKPDDGSVDDLLADLGEPDSPDSKDSKAADFLEVNEVGAGVQDNFGIEVKEEEGIGIDLDPEIFRAYDIRGITTTNLTEEVVYWIGKAFAAEALAANRSRVAIGWDGRHSSEPLAQSLTRGLTEAGMDVMQIGAVPTPVLYYATYALDTGTGIMITGSHNPPEYNGLKMMIAGVTLAEDRIQALLTRLQNGQVEDAATVGDVEEINLHDSYIDRALEDVAIAQPLKVVVDCGNGIAGVLAPRLLQEAGCEVIPLYCEVDGDFPNHHPDPAEPANLEDLITVVQAEGADLGLAFDGDGDRLGVVTNSGKIIWPDKLLMLFAQDIVSRNPGADIIYDVKCSRNLNTLISDLGGRPIMWRTGHSHMKAKIKETGALLAGEFSGHICFGERWYGFDDALYSAIRLLEIVSSENQAMDDLFAAYPEMASTPEIKINTTESAKFEIMHMLEAQADFAGGSITSIDGIRVDFEDGWGLIRPSNTSPVLSLRFEADDETALQRIQTEFQNQLDKIDPSLKIQS